MKNFKTTLILLAVLAGLLAVTAVVNLVQKSSGAGKDAAFKKFDRGKATSLVVRSRTNNAVLVKKDGRWLTEDGFPVDTTTLSQAFGHLDSMTTKQLVSRNPQKQVIFEVDSAKGVRVQVAAGSDTVVDVYLGKSGSDYNSTYFRGHGADEVYLYGASVKWTFNKNTESWRDMYVARGNADDVNSVVLTYPDGELELVRGMDGTWRIARPQDSPARQTETGSLVGGLVSMRASSIKKMEGPVDYGFTNPVCTAQVMLKNGSSYSVVIGTFDTEKKQYPVKREDGSFVYTISEHQASTVMKRFEELKEEPKADSTGAEGFEKK